MEDFGNRSSKEILEKLNKICTSTLYESLEGDALNEMEKSFAFARDLSLWSQILTDRPESFLFKKASEEYLTSILNLGQGQYRNAFKCLRLVLELCLQGIHLSTNLLDLQEWLNNSTDTNWSFLIDSEKGPLSNRFCTAFFPEIKEHAKNFQSMARTLYRELSETVHCNVPYCIPLPDSFKFCELSFKVWHEKSATTCLIIHFCFCVRYLKLLTIENRFEIHEVLNDNLGHIEQIRILLGGPTTK